MILFCHIETFIYVTNDYFINSDSRIQLCMPIVIPQLILTLHRYLNLPLRQGSRVVGKRDFYYKMMSSSGNIFRITGPFWGSSPVTGEFPHKGQWRRALMYPLICAWTNDWVNTRDPDDLRRHGVHYGVTVMDPCGLLTSYSELKYRSMYGLPVSCRYEYNTISWNTSSWKTSTDMSYKANIVADDG